jgi:hypothetical protein
LLWSILNSSEFRASAGARWKRPGEFVQSVHRSLQVDWDRSRVAMDKGPLSTTLARHLSYLNVAGHRPRSWPGPDGYPDKDSHWMGSSAILQCIKLASNGKPVDPELVEAGTWAELMPVSESYAPSANALILCRALTGYTPNPAIRQAVADALTGPTPAWTERVNAAVRVVLTSPLAFLR